MSALPHKNVVTRFAPSPTGHLHIGGIRTALFSYLYARKHDGKFILRIEDTDKERSKKEYEESILESFKWLGLEYDELHRQSENTEKYKVYLQALVENGKAYVSQEKPKEPGDRDSVIRLKNPNKEVTFADHILGDITVDTTDLGDFIIAKDFDTPIFHFANVVDDHEMGVTHIIRGQEHAPNTPRQMLIYEVLGWETPEYAHIPLILALDKTKLSKRHGAANTLEYRDEGYLPDAILNFLALIGWNPGTEQELFTRAELIEQFCLEKVQKGPGVFNQEKLDWTNREYLKKMPFEEQEIYVGAYMPASIKDLPTYTTSILHSITPIIMERISKGSEIKDMAAEGELTYFFTAPVYDKNALFFKSSKIPEENKYVTLANYLKKVTTILAEINETEFTKEKVKEVLWPYAEEVGRGDILWPIRYALSGRDKSPDPFTLCEVLGKEETLLRIETALQILEK